MNRDCESGIIGDAQSADSQLYGCCSLSMSVLQCLLLEGKNRLSVPIAENVKKDNMEGCPTWCIALHGVLLSSH